MAVVTDWGADSDGGTRPIPATDEEILRATLSHVGAPLEDAHGLA